MIYAALDEREQALNWLERSYEAREGFLVFVKMYFDEDWATEPRFQAQLRKMGLDG